MELFFDANKIFVPSNATKAPDISCFIYIFPVLKASGRRENSISHQGMCQRIAYLLNGIKMQLSTL